MKEYYREGKGIIMPANRLILLIVLLFVVLSILAFGWSLRPVEIVAVHQRGNYSDVLVNNFPFTDKGKINWWLKNKEKIKKNYDIPQPASYGFFTIIFWDFGSGYKEPDKYDRVCFDDVREKENCIDKNKLFTVRNDRNGDIIFSFSDARYRLNKNGEITKLKRKSD